MQVSTVSSPPALATGSHYLANRHPLLPSPLCKLPLGTIRAGGWLGHQLTLMVDGMTGRLDELSPWVQRHGWFGGDAEGWEEQAYWFRGFYDLAVLTGDTRLQSEARRWIDGVLGSMDADGYFGAQPHKRVTGNNGQSLPDLWPHMVMIDALIHHHEATGDARVIPFLLRFFAFCRAIPDDEFVVALGEGFGDWRPWVQKARAGDMLPHLFWLYNQTGEEWLLPLADRFFAQIAPPASEWLDEHVVNFTQRFAYPGLYFLRSHDPRHLALSEYWYQQHMGTWGQQPRGIFGADELIQRGRTDPRQGFETCGMVEFNKSFYVLGRITGDPRYADRCEDITLNHFPAAQTPDLRGLHYLTASNQPQLDNEESHEYKNQGRMISYSPHLYRCCQHNVAMGWPWYVQNLWQATADRGLATWLYAENAVHARVGAEGRTITIQTHTDYPFQTDVTLHLRSEGPVEFPLYLRVPRWCNGCSVSVNGVPVDVAAGPGAFVCIRRRWTSEDHVELALPMETTLTTWPRSNSVTVDRGPLSYSVRIGERWDRVGGDDRWPEWAVFPTTPYNYGLVLDARTLEPFLTVSESGFVTDQPWTVDSAPVTMRAKARRIPGWGITNNTIQEVPQAAVADGPDEEITLIPLGCARLRVACLPRIIDRNPPLSC